MNTKSPIDLIKDAITGKGPDCMNGPTDPVQSTDEVLGEVPEILQQIFAQANFRAEYTCKAFKGMMRPEKYSKTGFSGFMDDIMGTHTQTMAAMILHDLAWQGIKNGDVVCRVAGELMIREGWKICRNKEASVVFDSPMFPDDHVVRTFFEVYRKIVSGQIVFDGNFPLPKLKPGQVVIGKIDDEAFRQMHMLHVKLVGVIKKFDPYPTTAHEYVAFQDKPAVDYFRFVGQRRLLNEAVAVASYTSRTFLTSGVDPEAIPEEFIGKPIGLGVAEGWEVFVGLEE